MQIPLPLRLLVILILSVLFYDSFFFLRRAMEEFPLFFYGMLISGSTIVLLSFLLKKKIYSLGIYTVLFALCVGLVYISDIHRGQFQFLNSVASASDKAEVLLRMDCMKRTEEKFSVWEASLVKVFLNQREKYITGKARVYTPSYVHFDNGQVIKASVRTSDFLYRHTPSLDDNFRNYAVRNGYVLSAFVNEKQFILIGKVTLSKWKKAINGLRNRIAVCFMERITDKRVAGLALAMWLGDEQFIGKELYREFSESGVIHILSVSGLHVGLMYMIVSFFLKNVPLSRLWKFLIVSLVLNLYSALCGMEVPVLRASWMFILAEALRYLPYYTHPRNLLSLLFCALVFLIYNPFLLFNLSFQLSFSSMTGLFMVYPFLKNISFFKTGNMILRKYFFDPVLITFSASFTTLPFVLYAFHSFTFISFLSNLVLVPLSFVFMLSAGLVFAGEYPALIAEWMGKFLLGSVSFFSSKSENITLQNIDFTSMDLLFALFFISCLLAIMYSKNRGYFRIALISAIVWASLSLYESYRHKMSILAYCEGGKNVCGVFLKNRNFVYIDTRGSVVGIKNNIHSFNYPHIVRAPIRWAEFYGNFFVFNDSILPLDWFRNDSVYIFFLSWKNFKKARVLEDKIPYIKVKYLANGESFLRRYE